MGGHASVVGRLVELGVAPSEIDSRLASACQTGNREQAKLLIACRANPDGVLVAVLQKGKFKFGRFLMDQGVTLQATDREGDLAKTLLNACSKSNLAAVTTLLCARVGLEVKGTSKKTPLLVAVETGSADVVATLLEHRANANVKNKDGRDALAICKAKGYDEIATILQPHCAELVSEPTITPSQLDDKHGAFLLLESRSSEKELVIEFKCAQGDTLGLVLDGCHVSKNAFVVDVRKGLAKTYNQSTSKEKQIRSGDFIVAANCVKDSFTHIMEELSKSRHVTITVKKPLEFEIQVKRTNAKLGIEVDYSDGEGKSLLITDVHVYGTIPDWNELNESEKVSVGDHIVAVNKIRGKALLLMNELRADRPDAKGTRTLSLRLSRPI